MPAFLKLDWTDIAQRRMKPAVVVERHPVNHLVHGLPADLEFPTVQPTHLQSTPETLRRCVDAPMSSRRGKVLQISQTQGVHLANDIAL